MRAGWLLLSLIALLTVGALAACGDASDDVNDAGDDHSDSDANDDDCFDDDDAGNDDDLFDDDTLADDDCCDDDIADDDSYGQPLFCRPDENIWNETLPITGGEIIDTIDIVVINDLTCRPIENAIVIAGDSETITFTGPEGKAQFTGKSGQTLVTAGKTGFGVRSFLINANKILFRLFPAQPPFPFTDSARGHFQRQNQNLEVQQAPFGLFGSGMINNPVFCGLAMQGISRHNAMQIDYKHGLFTRNVFEAGIEIEELGLNETFSLPHNVWIPTVEGSTTTNNPGLDHPYYRLAENRAMNEMALMGVVLRLNTNTLGVEGIANLIEVLGSGNLDALNRDLVPLAQDIVFAGIEPAYLPGNRPNIEMLPVDEAKMSANFTRSGNLAGENDYFTVLMAEIAQRSFVPMSIGHLNHGAQQMAYASIDNADYFLLTVATGLLAEEKQNFSVTVTNIENIQNGANVDGFVPYFEQVDYDEWESACKVSWILPEGDANMQPNMLHLAAYNRLADQTLLVEMPASTTSFTVPAALNWTCATVDSSLENYDVIVMVASYTHGLNLNQRDYQAILAQTGGFSIEVSVDLLDQLW